MIKYLLFSAFLLFACFALKAQDFDFGAYNLEELNMKTYKNDTAAHAVVLNEFGNAWISSQDQLPLYFDYHVKIKIFDTKGFDKGNIEIPLYTDGQDIERIDNIQGVTYYFDDNGNAQKTELDRKDVYTTKENKYWSTAKFAMPNLRKGCIIEYKYRITSPFKMKFRTWDFQSDIPKVISYFKAKIPAVYNYNISLRGGLKLLEGPQYKSELEKDCFSYYGTKADCSVFKFVMKDIPAFVEEEYMTSRRNFLSAIYFELSDYYNLSTGTNQKISKQWKDVDYELKHAYWFGGQIRKKDYFKKTIAEVVSGKNDTLEKAQAVYSYIKSNVKWNNIYGIGTDDGVRKAFNNRTGDVADINLGLIAALHAADIDADAVLLSTRSHGIVNKLYPVISEFNYVIAKVDIGGKTYLLDATDPYLPFGIIPMHCLNDQGRVMSLDNPSYWIDLTGPSSISTSMLVFTLHEDGKLRGTITHYSLGYEAYNKRKKIAQFNTTHEYVEDLDEKQPKLKILKSEIINLDSLNLPLSEVYEVEIDAYDNLDAARLSFNPFIFNRLSINPFKQLYRSYPVDWGMPSTEKVILQLNLPESYSVEVPPKKMGIALPNNGGSFITAFENNKNQVKFSHLINFNKAIYSSEEYPYLKELYNQIILSEKVDMVFKKN